MSRGEPGSEAREEGRGRGKKTCFQSACLPLTWNRSLGDCFVTHETGEDDCLRDTRRRRCEASAHSCVHTYLCVVSLVNADFYNGQVCDRFVFHDVIIIAIIY